MPLHTGESYNNVILQCRILQEVLNTYRNLMADVQMEFGVDTSESDQAFHIGTHAIGTIMAEAKGLTGGKTI